MAHPAPSLGHYQFAAYTVDVRAFELRKHGVRIKLQERPLQILIMFLERPGEVVTREELRKRLWPDGTFVDFDHGISSAVNKLRTALNDSAAHPRYIETIGRQGYRFIYPVAPRTTTIRVLENRPVLVPPRPSARRRWLVLTVMAALLLATLAAFLAWQRGSGQPKQIRSIAVLPLKNLSSDAEQEYFSEGLTEELIGRLASLRELRVISRTSVMQYKDSTKPTPQIARELGVDAIVEGSVLRSGNRVRIAAQLISAAEDRSLWAASYDRDQRDILALQSEVAREIVDNIDLTVAAKDRERLTAARKVDPEAHEFYLRAQHHWARRNAEDIRTAIALYDKAIERDPTYADAHAGRAQAYALLGGYEMSPQEGYIRKARAAALRALELDSRLSQAHTSLAVIAQNYDWDWQTAEKEYQEAIRLDPNNATAHHWYAEYLGFQGRFDEAFTEIGRAEQLDPKSLIIQTDHAAILIYARQYDRAVALLQAVLQQEPDFPRAHGLLQSTYILQDKPELALAEVQNGKMKEYSAWKVALIARAYDRTGQHRKAEQALAELRKMDRERRADAISLIIACSTGHLKDEAFAWLELAYQQHSNALSSLKVNPIYDPLRSDPRFDDLLQRIGLK